MTFDETVEAAPAPMPPMAWTVRNKYANYGPFNTERNAVEFGLKMHFGSEWTVTRMFKP